MFMFHKFHIIISQILGINNTLPHTNLVFQLPPPPAQETNIHFFNVLNTRTSLFLAFRNDFPFHKMIFPFFYFHLAKKKLFLFVKIVDNKQVNGFMINEGIRQTRVDKCGSPSNRHSTSPPNNRFLLFFYSRGNQSATWSLLGLTGTP